MNQLTPRLFPTFPASGHLMDHVLRDLFEPARGNGNGAGRPSAWRPQVDLTETEQAYVIQAELPGIDPADVEITVERDTLTLKGEKKGVEKREGDAARVVERRYGAFTRTFRFPEPLADDAVSAAAKNGLLTITVAKAPEATPKRIVVHTEA